MSGLFEKIVANYNYVVHTLADPRTQDWWAVRNPFVVLTILSSYLYFCRTLGPRLMKDRKPFQLKKVLLIYNLFQVLLSLYLVYRGTKHVFSKEYSLACELMDPSNSPKAMETAASFWWYYFAKITELLDTIFFVLRKKNNQVTFLHVYHHTLMTTVVWYATKYYPGGHMLFMGYLNSIVHVIMYTYYLVSGLGPQFQKYIWWKKHVTVIQLIQFVIVLIHNVSVFFYECDYPKVYNILCSLNALAFINMFGRFYIRSYQKQSRGKGNDVRVQNGNKISEKMNARESKRGKTR